MASNFTIHTTSGKGIDVTPRLMSDGIEFMSVYIALMRADRDNDTLPVALQRFNEQTFAPGTTVGLDKLRQLAVYAADKIYRFAAELEVRDAYTDVYFTKVVARLVRSLKHSGIKLFYVLDNEMREDRFALTVDLFQLSGFMVVTPYAGKDTLGFEAVERKLKRHLSQGDSVVYIEKDASVNYVEKAILTSAEWQYTRVFRNHAPTQLYRSIVASLLACNLLQISVAV